MRKDEWTKEDARESFTSSLGEEETSPGDQVIVGDHLCAGPDGPIPTGTYRVVGVTTTEIRWYMKTRRTVPKVHLAYREGSVRRTR